MRWKRPKSHIWSKLKKQVEDLFDPSLDLQIHCTWYLSHHGKGMTRLPRYWITLNKEVVFDDSSGIFGWPWIGHQLRYYVENSFDHFFNIICNKEEHKDPDKHWKKEWNFFFEILVCADRRLGKRRIATLKECNVSELGLKILQEREKV